MNINENLLKKKPSCGKLSIKSNLDNLIISIFFLYKSDSQFFHSPIEEIKLTSYLLEYFFKLKAELITALVVAILEKCGAQ